MRWGPIDTSATFLCPSSSPVVPGQTCHALTELGEGDARRLRSLGIEARACHARQRVRFQTKNVPPWGDPKVDPRVTVELQRTVRHDRILLQLSGQQRLDPGPERLFFHSRPGPPLVIVETLPA